MMQRNYQIVKAVFLFLLAGFTAVMLSLETTDPSTGARIKNIDQVMDFFLYDPYVHDIVEKVDKSRAEILSELQKISEYMDTITADRAFVEDLFYYSISRKTVNMSGLVNAIFPGPALLKDFFILDKSNVLLYKHGGDRIQLEYQELADRIEWRLTDSELMVLCRYHDKNLESDLLLTAHYNRRLLEDILRKSGFGASMAIGEKIIINNLLDFSDKNRRILVQKRKTSILDGWNIFESMPVIYKGITVAALGLVYPARSLGSIMLTAAKFAGIFLIIALFIILDRFFYRLFGNLQNGGTRKKNKPGDNSDQLEQANLDWVGNYIENLEETIKEKNNGEQK